MDNKNSLTRTEKHISPAPYSYIKSYNSIRAEIAKLQSASAAAPQSFQSDAFEGSMNELRKRLNTCSSLCGRLYGELTRFGNWNGFVYRTWFKDAEEAWRAVCDITAGKGSSDPVENYSNAKAAMRLIGSELNTLENRKSAQLKAYEASAMNHNEQQAKALDNYIASSDVQNFIRTIGLYHTLMNARFDKFGNPRHFTIPAPGYSKRPFYTHPLNGSTAVHLPETGRVFRIKLNSNSGLNTFIQGMHSYAANFIRYGQPSETSVSYINCLNFSDYGMEAFRELYSGSTGYDVAFAQPPADLSEARQLLKRVRTLADEEAHNGISMPRSVIILGWEKICAYREFRDIAAAPLHLNITLIIADSGYAGAAEENAIKDIPLSLIYERGGGMFLSTPSGDFPFYFYGARFDPTPGLIKSIKSACKKAETSYRYFDYASLPAVSDYKCLNGQNPDFKLLYGIDKSGKKCYWDTMDLYGSPNFAGYLLGSTASGKSTTLNCLVASLVLNYHPDDAEIWAADFKASLFKDYADHMPPHFRYILLDENPDATYSFIDSIYAEFIKRRSAFRGKDIWNYRVSNPNERVPFIFVIIDEFSAMANAITSSPDHQHKLNELLKMSRSFGFKYLFTSQSFTGQEGKALGDGINNIAVRICMSCMDKSQMRDVLGGKTVEGVDQVDTLPIHKTLHRLEVPKYGSGRFAALYVNSLFMPHDDYTVYLDYISKLSRHISFTSKDSTVSDPTVPVTFRSEIPHIQRCLNETKTNTVSSNGHICLCLGKPIHMERAYSIVLHNRQFENILISASLISHVQADGCVCILNSLIQSALENRCAVELWTQEDSVMLQGINGQRLRNLESHDGFSIHTGSSVRGQLLNLARRLDKGEHPNTIVIIPELNSVSKLLAPRQAGLSALHSLLGGSSASAAHKHSGRSVSEMASSVSSKYASLFNDTANSAGASDEGGIDMNAILKELLNIGAEFGVHFVGISESTTILHKSMEGVPALFRHRAAFDMPSGSEKSIEFELAVNRALKDRSGCFYYTDGLIKKVMKPYLI